jgi:hypothetical protein
MNCVDPPPTVRLCLPPRTGLRTRLHELRSPRISRLTTPRLRHDLIADSSAARLAHTSAIALFP